MLDLTPFLSNQERKDLFELSSYELHRKFIAEKIKSNFPMLVYLLGFRDIGNFHKKELVKIANTEGDKIRRLWLWARGHFKTSIITEAHSIFLIINNPDIRILLVSNTLDIAKSMLRNIKTQFMANEAFREIFREYCPPSKDGKVEFGTTEQFTACNRTRVLKEPTCMCAGVGTNLTGLHFDYMKIDDLVTAKSVTNEEQIRASKEYYSSLRQLFDNPINPKEDVIGTTYHFNDLYQDILASEEFDKSIIPAKKDGEIVFYERFTDEGLNAILNDYTIGPWQFHAQYMLNPVNPKDAKFKKEWVVYYDDVPKGLTEYICVDPASTQKKKSDYTVIERWGIDYEGYHYLLEGVRDKLNSFQRIDKLFEVVKNSKNLRWVKYEVLGGRHGDLDVINQRKRLEGIHFTVNETKATNASKIDRIEQRLVGAYHSGIIKFPRSLSYRSLFDGKTHDFVQDLITELLQFPHTSHDDCLDCQSQMFEERLQLGTPPTKKDLEGFRVTPDGQLKKELKKRRTKARMAGLCIKGG